MTLYRINRPMGGPVSDDDMNATAFRANVCMAHFPGMKWHRSFLDRNTWTFQCIYEAESEEAIREHAKMAAVPCEEVVAVEEYTPDPFE
ncbi:hypothetical protein AYO38_03630 [bacterium SCGC AG-212-C10]|nr:hypothetical protein AYO38_03630 [bacterium SCGC AG-212-C10]